MVYQLNNNCLPREILQMIFENLTSNKSNIKNCMLVCKSWSFVAQGFFSSDISITLPPDLLSNLLNDIPIFSQKVMTINLHDPYGRNATKDSSTDLQKIVEMCPNLVSLTLNCLDPEPFLDDLNSSVAKLDKIQKIHLTDQASQEPYVRILYLELNLKYCRTITTLDICTLEEVDSFGIKENDLASLIAKFPNLEHFRASYKGTYNADVNVDLKHLLNAAPQLQTLKLYKMDKITTHSQNKDVKDVLQGSKLTKLKLVADNIDIESLKFITSNLINVNHLELIVEFITPDHTLTQEESLRILEDLKSYALEKKRLVMQYYYRNQHFFERFNKLGPTDSDSEGYDDDDHDHDQDEQSDQEISWEQYVGDQIEYDALMRQLGDLDQYDFPNAYSGQYYDDDMY